MYYDVYEFTFIVNGREFRVDTPPVKVITTLTTAALPQNLYRAALEDLRVICS